MRLPLLPTDHVEPDRRDLYDAFAANVRDNFPDIETTDADGALLGPWGVWMQVPTVGRAMMTLIGAIREIPDLDQAARQVVILMTGARSHAAYEIYAHAAAARAAGLTDEQVSTLLAGGRPGGLTTEQEVAADVAAALLDGGVLPAPIYDRAVTLLGQDGLNSVVFSVAQYSFVGVMLNAYDVPVVHGTEPVGLAHGQVSLGQVSLRRVETNPDHVLVGDMPTACRNSRDSFSVETDGRMASPAPHQQVRGQPEGVGHPGLWSSWLSRSD